MLNLSKDCIFQASEFGAQREGGAGEGLVWVSSSLYLDSVPLKD